MNTVYLTRRNLETLLNKLDRAKGRPFSNQGLLKNDTKHPEYPCSDRTLVLVVEDEEYYTDRNPGFSKDAPVD